MSDNVVIDLEALTLDDLEAVEKLTGRRASALFTAAGAPADMGALKAVVTVLMRKTDPEFSMEDAGRIKVSALTMPGVNGANGSSPLVPNGQNGSSSSPASPTSTTTRPSRSAGSRSSRRTR